MNRLRFRVFVFFVFWYATNVQCLLCSAYFEAKEMRRKEERDIARRNKRNFDCYYYISKSESGWDYAFVSEYRFERAKINNINGDTMRYRVSVAMDICRSVRVTLLFEFFLGKCAVRIIEWINFFYVIHIEFFLWRIFLDENLPTATNDDNQNAINFYSNERIIKDDLMICNFCQMWWKIFIFF